MQLQLQSELVRNIALIRCRGKIVTGEEVRALQLEVEKLTLGTKRLVLHLEQVEYIDSGGLGALVRLSRVLHSNRGGLALCLVPVFVLKVLQVTNLIRVLHIYGSEAEAIQSFSERLLAPQAPSAEPRTRILCVDSSDDLLAFISGLLRPFGFEVYTTSRISDARMLALTSRPRIFICGPGVHPNDPAIEKIRQMDPQMSFLGLPPDFSSAEASRTSAELVGRIRALLPAP